MQRLNRVLRVQNVLMLKCSQQQQQASSSFRTNSLSRVLVLRNNNLSNSNRIQANHLVVPFQFNTQLAAKRFYASGNLPEHSKILLPALSPTMEQGKFFKLIIQVLNIIFLIIFLKL